MSLAHFTFGALEPKSRSNRFSATGNACLESVVVRKRGAATARRPAWRIIFATRCLPQQTPAFLVGRAKCVGCHRCLCCARKTCGSGPAAFRSASGARRFRAFPGVVAATGDLHHSAQRRRRKPPQVPLNELVSHLRRARASLSGRLVKIPTACYENSVIQCSVQPPPAQLSQLSQR
jgi:hypothetical protein